MKGSKKNETILEGQYLEPKFNSIEIYFYLLNPYAILYII